MRQGVVSKGNVFDMGNVKKDEDNLAVNPPAFYMTYQILPPGYLLDVVLQ